MNKSKRWPVVVRQVSPFEQGINAWERGVRWDACPRFDSANDQWEWQRGWAVASRDAMKKPRRSK